MSPLDLTKLPQPWVPGHPDWKTLHDLAWNLAYQHIREARGRRYIDAAWDGKRNYQWVWDTCFISQFTRYAPDVFPGIDGLDNFYELQREDGFIAMTYDLDKGTEPWPDRINPPLQAWAEWNHFRLTGDSSRLERACTCVGRFMAWMEAHRRTVPHSRLREANGQQDQYQLFWFEDCGSSGMDDSPRTPRSPMAGAFFDWVDLSSQMALSYRCLSQMAKVLGQPEQALAWSRRAEELGDLINQELWCEADQFYHDRMLPRNFVASKTIAGFWPLLAGFCPQERVQALIDHLENPQEFARPNSLPSLSADDPNYQTDGRFWRGGVWAPANYMVVEGLRLHGRHDKAHQLARRYLEALVRVHDANQPHTLWECIAPDSDQPGRKPYSAEFVKPDFVGWSGLGPLSMFYETVLGFDVNAVDGIVTWNLELEEPHGILRLPVGGRATADFRWDGELTATSERALTLHVVRRGKTSTWALQPGQRLREVLP